MPRRRFTVADGMVLIAGSAMGLGLLRAYLVGYEHWGWDSALIRVYPSWMSRLPDRHQVAAVVPLLAAWSLAVLALQLTKPRLPLRRLVRRRGFSACVATAFGVALWLTMSARWMIPTAITHGAAFGYILYTFVEGMPKLVVTSIGAT